MKSFEEVLEQYEPMITASMRKLNVYGHYEQFRQTGRIALWLAWKRYDEEKGHFAPFASKSIRGAILDSFKKDFHESDYTVSPDDELLLNLSVEDVMEFDMWSEELAGAIAQLTVKDRELIKHLYIDGSTQAEYARFARISISGVKKRRERMLKKLRELLL